MLKTYLKIFFILSICLFNSCSYNNVQLNPKSTPMHSFDYWVVLNNNDYLYTTSFPLKCNTGTKNRNLHYFMIVLDKNTLNYIVTIVGGKNYFPLSEVIIKVNYNEYYLPIYKDRAWLTNSKYVKQLIEDMLESNELITINTFEDKTQAIDTYGLKGLKEAINKIENLKSNL